MDKIKEIIRSLLRFLVYLLPVIFILIVGYIFYLKITKYRVEKTQEDLVYFMQHVRDNYPSARYMDFNADFIGYSDFLPLDVKIKQSDTGNDIYNRFGGKMIFNESPKTIAERKNYLYIKREEKMFKAQYKGLGAYVVMFTELKRHECIEMAITDWKSVLPNFMGVEASFVSEREPYNGLERINYFLLTDNQDEEYKSADNGTVSRKPLTQWEALRACNCMTDNCVVTLKFL